MIDIQDILKEAKSQIDRQIEQEVQQFRQEAKKRHIEALVQKLLDAEDTSNETVVAPKNKKKKRTVTTVRAKRQLKGFTKPAQLVPIILSCLRNNGGSLPKRDLAKKIIDMNILNSADLFVHKDRQHRFYKSLDRAKRLIQQTGQLKCENGIWSLISKS